MCAMASEPTHGEAGPALRVVMMPRDTNPQGTIFGGILLGLFAVLIGASMTGRERRFQMLCIGLFIPAMLFWILLGFLELVYCAS